MKDKKIIKILNDNKKEIIRSSYPASKVIDILNNNNIFKNLELNKYNELRIIVIDWFNDNNVLFNINNLF